MTCRNIAELWSLLDHADRPTPQMKHFRACPHTELTCKYHLSMPAWLSSRCTCVSAVKVHVLKASAQNYSNNIYPLHIHCSEVHWDNFLRPTLPTNFKAFILDSVLTPGVRFIVGVVRFLFTRIRCKFFLIIPLILSLLNAQCCWTAPGVVSARRHPPRWPQRGLCARHAANHLADLRRNPGHARQRQERQWTRQTARLRPLVAGFVCGSSEGPGCRQRNARPVWGVQYCFWLKFLSFLSDDDPEATFFCAVRMDKREILFLLSCP